MKNTFRILVPTILLLAFTSLSAHAQNKIATVDVSKIFTGYWKTKQAENALNDRKADLAKEDRTMLDNLKKAHDEYLKLLESANDQAVSVDERTRRKQAADDKSKDLAQSQAAIKQFEDTAQSNLAEQSSRMRENILNEINAAVIAKAKAGGYSVVLDSSAKTLDRTASVLYSSPDVDLTAAVLVQLNAGREDAAAAADKSAPAAK